MVDSSPRADSHFRSVLKGLSYRSVATISTVAISFVMTGSIKTATMIGSAEAVAKVLLFWGHERLWHRIRWGRPRSPAREPALARPRSSV
jgi:adenylylsulfate kinase